MKTFWKIFSAFFAFLMSILLVLSLILFPAVSFATENSDPGKLVDALFSSGIFELPFKPSANRQQILLSNGSVSSDPESVGMDAILDALEKLASTGLIDVETLMEELEIPADTKIDGEQLKQELIESEAMQTLAEVYAEDIINAALDTEDAPILTTESVMDILTPHMEEIVTIVENNIPEEVQVNREKIEKVVDKTASAALPDLVDTLPPAQEVSDVIVSTGGETLSTAVDVLKFVRGGQLRSIAIAVIAVLLVLVFLLRLPSINGLRWVGISGLVGAVFAGALGYLLQAKPVLDSLQSAISEASSLVMPLLSSLASTFVTFAIIYGVVGLVLVVGNGVLRAVIAKKEM